MVHQGSKKKILLAGLAVLLAAGAGFGAYKAWRSHFQGTINVLALDLAAPYAYVATPSLSKLPRDVVKAPVLRDVLTEDFVFYYEDQEDRLSLDGALKRIAFEHDLTLPDQLISAALDQPAEIAWWPDAKGAPRFWLLAMTRGALAKTLQGLAAVAAKDSQLSVIASVSSNGSDINAYALTLSPRRTLVLLSQGDRLVVLSDPGLLFDAERNVDKRAMVVVASLLSGEAATQSVFRHTFGLDEQWQARPASTLIADARLLSFGYQHFFPGVQALRFDIDKDGSALHTALRVETTAGPALPETPADRAVWAALPSGPAACTLLPVDWAKTQALWSEAKTADPATLKDFATAFEGPAAVCWYAKSQLHTPLFLAQTRADAGAGVDKSLDQISRWSMPAKGEASNAAGLWQYLIGAPWGAYEAGDGRAYKPTLARQGRWVMFSPDDQLVDLALKTQASKFPGVADSLPSAPAGATLAVGAPSLIADLLQREAFAVLPAEQEVLRQAAQQHLVPRLDALRKLPPARAVAQSTADGKGWVAIDWQAIKPAP